MDFHVSDLDQGHFSKTHKCGEKMGGGEVPIHYMTRPPVGQTHVLLQGKKRSTCNAITASSCSVVYSRVSCIVNVVFIL